MADAPDGLIIDGKATKNDLESAKFTKDKDTVDVVQPTAKLIGLTKEQLEQYRNDPFWKAVRYSLFVAFWLIWLAMFVGAILIVILSPKCPEVKWTQKMAAYKIFTLAYYDADSTDGLGDFAGILKQLPNLKEMGITAVWPSPVLSFDKNALSPEAVVSLDVSEQLGGENGFKELVKMVHAKDIKIVVDLPLTVDAKADNWAKKLKGAYSEDKEGITLVDLAKEEVRVQLLNLVKRFLDFGVDGLSITDYGLFPNNQIPITFVQQIRALPGAEKLSILSVSASPTADDNIYQLKSLVGDKPSDEGLGGLKKRLEDNLSLIKNESVGQNEGGNHTATRIWSLGSMDPEGNRLDQLLGSKATSFDSTQKKRISSLITAIQLFIPGPTSILYGEELGLLSGKPSPSTNKKINRVVYPLNNETKQTFFTISETPINSNFKSQEKESTSPLSIFKTIAKFRQSPDFVLGKFTHSNSGDLGCYVVERFPSNDGFFALIVNWAGATVNLNNQKLPTELQGSKKLDGANVRASSDGALSGKLNLSPGADPIKLGPYSVLVLDIAK